jgi:two-component system, LytTR family, response regulator
MVTAARKIRVLVVDDEPLARDGITVRLQREPDIEIVGEAADGPDAVHAICTLQPELVFLDVEMPGMNGLEVLRRSAAVHLPVVVFVTAHSQYAVEAFEVHALDYLLKPIDPVRLQAALERARRELARADRPSAARVGALLRSPAEGGGTTALGRLVARDGERYVLVKPQDIDWIQAAANYLRLHVGGRVHLMRGTMNDLEARLDPRQFARIHRSTIVNIDRIRDIVPEWHGDYDVTLISGEVLKLSRTYRGRLLP